MTVKELRELLANHPDDMEVIIDRYSDYESMDSVTITQAVENNGWLMQSSSTMSDENKAKEKDYLHFGC